MDSETENWLNSQAQRVEISPECTAGDPSKSSWKPVSSNVHEGFILGPILYNILINYLNNGEECSCGKFTDNPHLGVVDMPQDHDAI